MTSWCSGSMKTVFYKYERKVLLRLGFDSRWRQSIILCNELRLLYSDSTWLFTKLRLEVTRYRCFKQELGQNQFVNLPAHKLQQDVLQSYFSTQRVFLQGTSPNLLQRTDSQNVRI
ncbi:Hypothetical_protein [Hexamita inflata]|uniref:Hypothetical_protein n=1 Tax=Hexamita inflata TaxID=28002 RepID=A0AA86NBV3_9EUKA|nr:Hypothetical protein HINF_LOCUS4464 [Hexamita inflata]